MTEPELNIRRNGDATLGVIAHRLDGLHSDFGELKMTLSAGLSDVAAAMTRLAVVDERLTTMLESQSRAFRSIENLGGDVRTMSGRVAALEIAAPISKQSSEWVSRGILFTVGAAAMYALKKMGFTE